MRVIISLCIFMAMATGGSADLYGYSSRTFHSNLDTLRDIPVLTTDSAFVRDAKAAVDSLYNLKFKSARQRLAEWRKRYPDHPLWAFWKGMEIWWTILPDLQNESRDQELFSQLEKASNAAEKVLEKHPRHRDAMLLRAMSKGLMARQYANRGRWLPSLNQARHAISTLSDLNDQHADIPDLLLGRGLLKYYAAYLPEEYPIVRTVSWVLPRGDKQEGLKLMKRAAEKSIYLRPEALYFLGKIYMNHEHQPWEALPYFERLYKRYTRNPYYGTQLIRALVRADHEREAMQWIDKMISREDIPYESVLKEELLAWKGRMLVQRKQPEKAIKVLRESYVMATSANLPKGTDRPFHVMAGYYLGKSHEMLGDEQKALTYYSAVSDAETSNHYRDKAREEMERLRD